MTTYATQTDQVHFYTLPKDYAGKMKEQPRYKWYKPILAFLLAVIIFFVCNFFVLVGQGAYTLSKNPDAFAAISEASSDADLEEILSGISSQQSELASAVAEDAYIDADFTDPLAIIFSLVGIVFMIPAVALGLKAVGLGGLRSLSSEQGGLRWQRIKKLILPILLATVIVELGPTFIELLVTGSFDELGQARFAPLALLTIVIVVPLQSAAEEYFFRGFLIQTFSSWIPIVAISLVLSAVVFGLGHSYDFLGNLGIAITGLLWAWLAVKTGGLEVTICLHAASNTAGMLFSSVYAAAAVTNTTSIESFVFNIVTTLVLVVIAYLLCKRHGYLIADKI